MPNMGDGQDYYNVLSIASNAIHEEVQTLYRRLALSHHPDKNNGSNATEMMQQINTAWEVLGDNARRAKYDAARPRLIATGKKPSHPESSQSKHQYNDSDAKSSPTHSEERPPQSHRRPWPKNDWKQYGVHLNPTHVNRQSWWLTFQKKKQEAIDARVYELISEFEILNDRISKVKATREQFRITGRPIPAPLLQELDEAQTLLDKILYARLSRCIRRP